MIISASRRTDLPAFYSKWLINRIRAGYCTVPNPFNRKQISRVSLKPEDVEMMVFWTRNPKPIMPYLKEIDGTGLKYYFQFTIMGNPRQIDPYSPSMETAINTFRALANSIGPEKVIWRYDPILFSQITHADFHVRQFQKIAESLQGYTGRTVISIVDEYTKNRRQFRHLSAAGIDVFHPDISNPELRDCIQKIVAIAKQQHLEIVSCAEDIDLDALGVKPGKCIDDQYIHNVFGIDVTSKKDPNQRKPCGCVMSKDIGMYNTCLYGCTYCYATHSRQSAQKNHNSHDPESPSLLGWYDIDPSGGTEEDTPTQPSLF
jgi:hypothetical protein